MARANPSLRVMMLLRRELRFEGGPLVCSKDRGRILGAGSHGRTLCYIYCRDDEKNAEVSNELTWDEGRRGRAARPF